MRFNFKKIVFLSWLFLFCMTTTMFGQQHEVTDDFAMELNQATNDSVKLVLLKEIVDSLKYIDTRKTLFYIKAYAELENNTDYIFAKGLTDDMYGFYYLKKDNYQRSYESFLKALDKAVKYKNEKGLQLINNNIGNIFHDKGEYYRAYDYHKLAFTASSLSGDTLYHCIFNMGLDMYYAKEYDKAIVALDKTKELLLKHQKTDDFSIFLLGDSYMFLSFCFNELNDFHKAEKAIYSAIDILSTSNTFASSLAKSYAFLGHMRYAKGLKGAAKSLYIKGADVASKNENVFREDCVYAYMALSDFYIKEQEYQGAIQYANKILDLGTGIKDSVAAISNILQANDHLKNNKAVVVYGDVLAKLKDRLHFQEQDTKIQNLLYLKNITQLEDENKLLASQTLVGEHELKIKKYIAFLIFAVTLLVMSLVVFFFMNNMYKEKFNQELDAKVEDRTMALKYANLKIESTNKELESFVYVTSQDLREPIRKIGNSILYIKQKGSDLFPPTAGMYFKFIENGVGQMEQLIDDVLDFATFSSGKIEVEQIDLNDLVLEAMQPIKITLDERNAVVNHPKLPKIYSNKGQLRMLLKNLIENGTKYNKSDQPTIDIAYEQLNDFHYITVADNGIGIAEENKDKVFGMFQRLNNDIKGTGLGLAICKDVVEAFGGEIKIESELGKGTQFIIVLPVIEHTNELMLDSNSILNKHA